MQSRDRLLHSILNNKPYIAAQVYERYKTCGNEHCKCRSGELHGPFNWIYQHKKGQKLISTTVAAEKLAKAKKLAANYQRWQEHRQQLRELDQSIQRNLDEDDPFMDIAVQKLGPSSDFQVSLYYFDGARQVLHRGLFQHTHRRDFLFCQRCDGSPFLC